MALEDAAHVTALHLEASIASGRVKPRTHRPEGRWIGKLPDWIGAHVNRSLTVARRLLTKNSVLTRCRP